MAERKYFNMKKDIHPDYRQVVFMDTTTGYQFLSGSTKHSNETVEFEGETYPLIRVEISSDSHPFSNFGEVGMGVFALVVTVFALLMVFTMLGMLFDFLKD